MPEYQQIAVVADDLTGALDAVAPFANAGLSVLVATAPAHLALALSAQVIGVSTNSREISALEAGQRMAEVAQMLRGIPVVIKKIDSRLKGHVAAELQALAQARGLSRALICPAIPDMGRLQKGGMLTGFGIATPLDIQQAVGALPGIAPELPDAETDAEIDSLLRAWNRETTLLVGARGLTAALARRMAPGAPAPDLLPLPRPIAMAIGSRDAITLAQVAALVEQASEAKLMLAPNGCAAQTPHGPLDLLQLTLGTATIPSPQATTAFARTFATQFATNRATLVLTGGETAAAVLDQMGIGLLDVLGEALPGLPLCRASEKPDAPLILCKSGGFGAPDCLIRLLSLSVARLTA
jgi:uncharacterized protein YgbK (DUF1537 family)